MSKPPFWITLLFSCLIPSGLEAHFLWKVHTEPPVYLYGTIHSSHTAVRDLPPEVASALRSSSSFHPELEFSPENIGQLTAQIFAGGTGDLEEKLPPALWKRLVAQSQESGIPPFLIRRVPLRLAPMIFANPPGSEFNLIVDVQLYQLAKEGGLSMHPLETIEEQIDVFNKLTHEQAISFLKEALDEAEAGFPSKENLVRLYAAGDLDGLMRLLEEEFERANIPELTERLLDHRNERMTERLLPFLKEGGAFVAVGAAHMPGAKGMITLIEQQGYTVTPEPVSRKK